MGQMFRAGLAEAVANRRSLLKAGAAGLLFSAAVGAPARAAGVVRKRRAYVLVLDGLRPEEIDSGAMPRTKELRDSGLHYPRAVSMPIMETLPNHVMMMTGVRPDRSGVPANSIYDPALGQVRTMDQWQDVRYQTILTQLARSGRATGTVLSKEYLYGIFGQRATYRWEPAPLLPVTGHAPDLATMNATLAMVREFDPSMIFVNLGDIDRFGHSDLTGTTLQVARSAALAATDLQVGRLVELLKSTDRWRDSLLIVLADHSMDWSLPDRVITLNGPLQADPLLAGNVQIADNGGADLIYFTGPASDRPAAVARIRSIAAAQPGVLAAYDRAATPSLRLGPNAGDVIVYCRAGWRFSDPDPSSNPIPGNHGHPATSPIPFFLAGGTADLKSGSSSYQARTIDVAPTVGDYFGVRAPSGNWDGQSRLIRR